MERITTLTDGMLLALAMLYAAVGLGWGAFEQAGWSSLGLLAIPAGVALSRWAVATFDHPAARVFRAGWPFLASPAVYLAEVHLVAHGPVSFVDEMLRATDVWLGLHAGRPEWALGGLAEELANLAYATYYMVPLVGLWVGVRWSAPTLARMALSLAVTTVICGAIWLILPAGGYHPTGSPTSEPFGPATAFVRWIYSTNPHYAAAFPSQHVGHTAAVVAVMRARGAPLALWLWVLAIWGATVFGQYHYAADGLAGAIVGALAGAVAMRLVPEAPPS